MSIWQITNPLFAAFIFAIASLCIKRGLTLGAGAMRTTFLVNTVFCIGMIPLWWLMPAQFNWDFLWIPVLAGCGAFLGALFQNLALRIGEVSVATPLMGSKILFVAIFSILIMDAEFPSTWWIAIALAVSGIFLLGYTKEKVNRIVALKTMGLTFLGVGSFALMDVLIAAKGEQHGFGPFVALLHVTIFILNFTLIPFFQGSLLDLPEKAFKWILAGGSLMVFQFFVLNRTIAYYADATSANILYSSRGVWSILLVWSVGHWFYNGEKDHSPAVLGRRLLGSMLLIGAIGLVVI